MRNFEDLRAIYDPEFVTDLYEVYDRVSQAIGVDALHAKMAVDGIEGCVLSDEMYERTFDTLDDFLRSEYSFDKKYRGYADLSNSRVHVFFDA